MVIGPGLSAAGDPDTPDAFSGSTGVLDGTDSDISGGAWNGEGTLAGYLGFRFRLTPGGSDFYHGWLYMAHNDDANTLTLYDLAYNDKVGAPITTGDRGTTPIPEPGALALAALGAMAALARGRARRARSS